MCARLRQLSNLNPSFLSVSLLTSPLPWSAVYLCSCCVPFNGNHFCSALCFQSLMAQVRSHFLSLWVDVAHIGLILLSSFCCYGHIHGFCMLVSSPPSPYTLLEVRGLDLNLPLYPSLSTWYSVGNILDSFHNIVDGSLGSVNTSVPSYTY